MDVGVLFSGGADSALAALLLEPHADVTLVSCSFGVTEDTDHAREAAAALGLPLGGVDLDPAVLDSAVDTAIADGFPRNAIQSIHEHALDRVAASGEYPFVADGTRRDDRTPTVSRSVAQRVEDRHEVGHLAPLAGIGHAAVDALREDLLTVETGPSEDLPTGDYEGELRAAIAEAYGTERVREIFPEHVQSRVTGRR